MKSRLSLLFCLLVCVWAYAAQEKLNLGSLAEYNERKKFCGTLPKFIVSTVLCKAKYGSWIDRIEDILERERNNLTVEDVELSIKAIALKKTKQEFIADSTPQQRYSYCTLCLAQAELGLFQIAMTRKIRKL